MVIRPSGTEPFIRVLGEGDDLHPVEDVVGEIATAIAAMA